MLQYLSAVQAFGTRLRNEHSDKALGCRPVLALGRRGLSATPPRLDIFHSHTFIIRFPAGLHHSRLSIVATIDGQG
jgi:hypothetical protein